MTIAVLGAGMVGRAIALDLAGQFDVTSFDLNKFNLEELNIRNPNIKTVGADLSLFNEYPNWFGPFDIVVCAVPGFMGFNALKALDRSW